MGTDIILKLGENHTTTLDFNRDYKQVYGLYTYEGKVRCLKDFMDIPFEDLTLEEQKEIELFVTEGRYELNPYLQ